MQGLGNGLDPAGISRPQAASGLLSAAQVRQRYHRPKGRGGQTLGETPECRTNTINQHHSVSLNLFPRRSEWGTSRCQPCAAELTVRADGHVDVRLLAVLSVLADLATLPQLEGATSSPPQQHPAGGLVAAQRGLVLQLIGRRCSELLGEFPTSLLEDEAILLSLLASSTAASEDDVSVAVLIPSAVQYRIGKKRVLQGCREVLLPLQAAV